MYSSIIIICFILWIYRNNVFAKLHRKFALCPPHLSVREYRFLHTTFYAHFSVCQVRTTRTMLQKIVRDFQKKIQLVQPNRIQTNHLPLRGINSSVKSCKNLESHIISKFFDWSWLKFKANIVPGSSAGRKAGEFWV